MRFRVLRKYAYDRNHQLIFYAVKVFFAFFQGLFFKNFIGFAFQAHYGVLPSKLFGGR